MVGLLVEIAFWVAFILIAMYVLAVMLGYA